MCGRCYRSFQPYWYSFSVGEIKCYCLYPYNESIKTAIFNLKACGDIEIAPLLLGYSKPFIKLRFRGYTIVPAPSFKEKNEARGFNHVIEIFRHLGMRIITPIIKTEDIKQSSQRYKNRQLIGNHLAYVGEEVINQKILLVDDICTSGATIQACSSLLLKHGALSVTGLVIARTILKEHKERKTNDINKTTTKPNSILQKAHKIFGRKEKR